MLRFDNCLEEVGAIRDFIPNYKINPQNMENLSVFFICLQQIFSMIKYNSDKKRLYEYVKENRDALGRLNLLLMAEKRYDDLERASKDREYRKQLFETFGI